MIRVLIYIALLYSPLVFSQTKEERARLQENRELLSNAEKSLQKDDFSTAEANYRSVIARDSKNTEARYNLGNAYYSKDKNREAGKRYVQAAETATSKAEKHKVYHNLGNVLMNDKQYKAAVEAYKNALRNNPTDDETRYNLALAKKMLEEHGDEGGDGEEENQEEDQNEKDQGQDQEDQSGGNEDQDSEDTGEEKESDPDQNAEEKDPKKTDKQEGQGQPQPIEGKLSPQQIQSLLEAMNNEEKKVQDKINAEKQKGVKVKPEKDW